MSHKIILVLLLTDIGFTSLSQTALQRFEFATAHFENGRLSQALEEVGQIEKEIGLTPLTTSFKAKIYFLQKDYENTLIVLEQYKVLTGNKPLSEELLRIEDNVHDFYKKHDEDIVQKRLDKVEEIERKNQQIKVQKQAKIKSQKAASQYKELDHENKCAIEKKEIVEALIQLKAELKEEGYLLVLGQPIFPEVFNEVAKLKGYKGIVTWDIDRIFDLSAQKPILKNLNYDLIEYVSGIRLKDISSGKTYKRIPIVHNQFSIIESFKLFQEVDFFEVFFARNYTINKTYNLIDCFSIGLGSYDRRNKTKLNSRTNFLT